MSRYNSRMHGVETDNLYVDINWGFDPVLGYWYDIIETKEDEQTIIEQGQATVIWTMTFSHDRLSSGESISVNGCSHLKFAEKIYYHRDYLDMGQMLYEHLPLFGRIVQFIKKRVA